MRKSTPPSPTVTESSPVRSSSIVALVDCPGLKVEREASVEIELVDVVVLVIFEGVVRDEEADCGGVFVTLPPSFTLKEAAETEGGDLVNASFSIFVACRVTVVSSLLSELSETVVAEGFSG